VITTTRPLSVRRLRHTLNTLIFATAVCVLLFAIRAYVAHGPRFSGFVWNLFLAWMPLGFALAIWQRVGRGLWGAGGWALAVCWLLFFPNAFYIVTDLIHVKKFGTDGVPRWYDLLMTAAFACGGMFLGCLSLYLLHLLVRQRWGWQRGWAFATAMLALGAFGIYLGRFSRLNSWDVIARPFKLLGEVSELALPKESREAAAFSLAFFLFSMAVYAFVVSVARIHELGDPPKSPES
jgi:uncharacterized membrane protein